MIAVLAIAGGMDLYGVAFGNDQFVTVGADGLTLLSVDGGAFWESHSVEP